ncbi:hypothetical protein RIF29_16328 [Crotalaria pallida]|uniref:Uncharacterized protein n=1 Tax=Crotalaria pallida TaxID=3830 RepID=A0AAN9FF16_CROPI
MGSGGEKFKELGKQSSTKEGYNKFENLNGDKVNVVSAKMTTGQLPSQDVSNKETRGKVNRVKDVRPSESTQKGNTDSDLTRGQPIEKPSMGFDLGTGINISPNLLRGVAYRMIQDNGENTKPPDKLLALKSIHSEIEGAHEVMVAEGNLINQEVLGESRKVETSAMMWDSGQ